MNKDSPILCYKIYVFVLLIAKFENLSVNSRVTCHGSKLLMSTKEKVVMFVDELRYKTAGKMLQHTLR